MSAAPICRQDELVMIKASSPTPALHGRYGTTVRFLGTRVFPCCQREHVNMWLVELQNPLQTPIGPLRHIGIEDVDLFPIRPGPDPEAIDTSRPVESEPSGVPT